MAKKAKKKSKAKGKHRKHLSAAHRAAISRGVKAHHRGGKKASAKKSKAKAGKSRKVGKSGARKGKMPAGLKRYWDNIHAMMAGGKKAAPKKAKKAKKAKHRGGGEVSSCMKCHKPIFGGAKGMSTHYARHHGGAAKAPAAASGGGAAKAPAAASGGGFSPEYKAKLLALKAQRDRRASAEYAFSPEAEKRNNEERLMALYG